MSWHQFAQADAFGTSPFQNLCCRELSKFLPDVAFQEIGESEKRYVVDIPVNNIEVAVYLDGAAITSPTLDLQFQRTDFDTPQALVLQLQKMLSNAI